MHITIAAALAIAAAVAPATLAWAGDFSCPDEISTRQSLAASRTASGFTPWVDATGTKQWLAGVDFYDGEPGGMAQLAPDNADADETVPRHWTFVVSKGQGELQIWQVCRYTSTSVTLTRRLPAGIKSCTVTRKKSLGSSALSVVCTAGAAKSS